MFLADYVRLDGDGLMTAVAMGYTHLRVEMFPAAHQLHVAGRFWLDDGEETISVRLRVLGAARAFEISLTTDLSAPPNEPDVDGARSAPFAAQLIMPLTGPGRYDILLEFEDGEVGRTSLMVVDGPEVPDGFVSGATA